MNTPIPQSFPAPAAPVNIASLMYLRRPDICLSCLRLIVLEYSSRPNCPDCRALTNAAACHVQEVAEAEEVY